MKEKQKKNLKEELERLINQHKEEMINLMLESIEDQMKNIKDSCNEVLRILGAQ